MTHTPGPWHIGRSVYDINDSQGRLIATFFRPGWWYPENEDEGISNRALGLAAPDMLAALKAIREERGTIDDPRNDGVCPVCGVYKHKAWCWYEQMEAAIAKAEGR